MTLGVSIVIVTYNSMDYIEPCLRSLMAAAHRWGGPVDYIIVDNASSDQTLDRIPDKTSLVTIKNSTNRGYGAAANQGIHAASQPWIMVLNPDTTCDDNFLVNLMTTIAPFTSSLINPLILCPDGTINAAGLSLHLTGVSACHGLGQSAKDFVSREPFGVACPSGAAVIAHRSVWQALHGFDEDYFLYMEDIDLGIRAWIQGYSCICLPAVFLYHDYRVRMTPQKFYYLEHNRLLMIRKLYSVALQRKLRWILRLTTILTCAYALTRGPSYVQRFFRAHRIGNYPTIVAALVHPLPTMQNHLEDGFLGSSPWTRLITPMVNATYDRLFRGRPASPPSNNPHEGIS